jgi:arylsulfatase
MTEAWPRCCGSCALSAMLALAAGCGSPPKVVVHELARDVAVADLDFPWQVVLFGRPAARPVQGRAFVREGRAAGGDTYAWMQRKARVLLRWREPMPRVALVDLAPDPDLAGRPARVLLNQTPVGRLILRAGRQRYLVSLPASLQKPGLNRLTFVIGPKGVAGREAGVVLYSLTVGAPEELTADAFLVPGAPPPVSFVDGSVPRLIQFGPGAIRYAIRVPPGGELRFTVRPQPGGSRATMRVTLEQPGSAERTLWSGTAGDVTPREVTLGLPDRTGEVVRLGLHVAPAAGERAAWATWVAPRVMASRPADPLSAPPPSDAGEHSARSLRQSLAGANVLLIVLDAAGARHFGCYGYARGTTPEIDRIASEGVLFERAFTTAVFTTAAMSALWTSQLPDLAHDGSPSDGPLPKGKPTLAEVLSAQGILTAAFIANARAGAVSGLERGFTELHEVYTLSPGAEAFRRALPPRLEEIKSRRSFVYVHFREPHFPYDPPPPFATRFGPEGPLPPSARRDPSWYTELNDGARRATPAEYQHLRRLYDGNLAYADQEVGILRKTLEAEGLWERTVVIVTADHGEALGEHALVGHNHELYEESIAVPLIIRFPAGKGPAGVRIKELVDHTDLAPTIADIFGVRGTGGGATAFPGLGLLPTCFGAPGREMVLARASDPRYVLVEGPLRYVFDGRSRQGELYDVVKDSGQERDLSEEQPIRADAYRQIVDRWLLGPGHRGARKRETRTLSPEALDNLRALGYVQ